MKKTGSGQSVPERSHLPLVGKANWRLIAGFGKGVCNIGSRIWVMIAVFWAQVSTGGKLL